MLTQVHDIALAVAATREPKRVLRYGVQGGLAGNVSPKQLDRRSGTSMEPLSRGGGRKG